MAAHSSVLAWRIPGTGEPGGLPSVGSTESDTTEVTVGLCSGGRGEAVVTFLFTLGLGLLLGSQRGEGWLPDLSHSRFCLIYFIEWEFTEM